MFSSELAGVLTRITHSTLWDLARMPTVLDDRLCCFIEMRILG